MTANQWQRRLSALAEKHGVPGAALGILRLDRDEIVLAHHGVLNTATGVEVTWDAAVRERLFAPLGLARTSTLPEEALLHRAAAGHVNDEPAAVWALPRSLGPAGTIFATTGDVLAFARMHLSGGMANGTRVLSEESAAAMASKQADVPGSHALGDSWGLGWIRFGWDGQRLIGHDGGTIGQFAFLRLLPSQGIAVVLLTNGGRAHELHLELYREIFAELAGVELSSPVVGHSRYLGRYERAAAQIDITKGDNGLRLKSTKTGPLASLSPDQPAVDLVPIGGAHRPPRHAEGVLT